MVVLFAHFILLSLFYYLFRLMILWFWYFDFLILLYYLFHYIPLSLYSARFLYIPYCLLLRRLTLLVVICCLEVTCCCCGSITWNIWIFAFWNGTYLYFCLTSLFHFICVVLSCVSALVLILGRVGVNFAGMVICY